MQVAVIIPAAGASSRFGDRDKLQEDLGGRPLLIRTVEFFTKRDEVSQIIVAGPPASMSGFRERFGGQLSFHGVELVEGGADHRWQSVKAALESVDSTADCVAVHDAARPALSGGLFDRLLLAASALPAIVPAIPISGTMKVVGDVSIEVCDEDAVADAILGASSRKTVEAFPIERTLDRHGHWEAQTPQVVATELLQRAYDQADLEGITDDAMAVERLGEPVHVIPGERSNIKVTHREDVDLIRAILGIKKEPPRPVHKRF